MLSSLKWDQFQPLFGKWDIFIKPFFDEGGFDPIYKQLKQDSLDKTIILPKSENTFKFLEKVDPERFKLLIIGLDPYPRLYKNGVPQATGLAFDCSNSPDDYIQPSLEAFFAGIEHEMGAIKRIKDLSYLCEQGVLLGNKSLTVKLDKTESYSSLWDPFWKFFLEDVVTAYFTDIPIILAGKEAKKLQKHIFTIANPTFLLEHPSAAARNSTLWETKGAFTKINEILVNNGKELIYWDVNVYDVPF